MFFVAAKNPKTRCSTRVLVACDASASCYGICVRDLLLGSAEHNSRAAVVGRALLLLGLVVYGLRLACLPIGPAIADSFLHLVNLPFHEAGHFIFAPLGRFMSVLGGSLTQLLVPTVCAGTLLLQTRDPFGAACCLWWFGENLLDLAPYIADARALQLVLLGGRTGAEVEGHDWEFLLESMGWLHFDQTLGLITHRVGVLVMLTAIIWAGLVLVAQWPSTSDEGV
jgi:hypothetical protein